MEAFDGIGKVFDLVIALPDEADCAVGGMHIAGPKPAVQPVSPVSLTNPVMGFSALMPVYAHRAPSFLLPCTSSRVESISRVITGIFPSLR